MAEIYFGGYIASDGVHVTIKNNSYVPNKGSRPANSCDLSVMGNIQLLKGWSAFKYQDYYTGQIISVPAQAPGPYPVQIAWSQNYPNGIPLPPMGQSKDVVIPFQQQQFYIGYTGYQGLQWLIRNGWIKANWKDDVTSGYLYANFWWGIQGALTQLPKSVNMPVYSGNQASGLAIYTFFGTPIITWGF